MILPPPLRVLVTGAGGLLGGAVCAALLERGHTVVGLVHRVCRVLGAEGEALPVTPWRSGGPDQFGLRIVVGDISSKTLGLDPVASTELAGSLDVIVHCAGVTGFSLDQDLYTRVNVAGTANVADFALLAQSPAAAPPALVHVSTAYVCGDRSGPIAEAPMTGRQAFSNLYEASKAAAEIEARLRRRRGLRVAVARPSVVVGDSRTGAIRRFDHFYGLMKIVAEGRIGVLPGLEDATLDLVPIDHVVGGIVDLAECAGESDGGIFHLVADQPTPLRALTVLGADYPQFRPAHFIDPDHLDLADVQKRERPAVARAVEVYAPYLRRDPSFEARNLRLLSGRVCPPLGGAYLRRLTDYAIATGFLRATAVISRPDISGPNAF